MGHVESFVACGSRRCRRIDAMIDSGLGDPRFAAAFAAWRDIVGPQHATSAACDIGCAEASTFAAEGGVRAIVRPGCAKEVQRCIAVANRHGKRLYPVSCGRNWGLGSRQPAAPHCTLLDLGRLNAIVAFDEDLAYMTVEPGVTFRQASEFLRDRGSALFVAVIGGSPDASLVGNTVERGSGIGPYADRAAMVCGMEVVLPTGELFHTGFGRFKQARAVPVSRHGVGPGFDGLFLQSNLGVVTKLTIWLAPRPHTLAVFRAAVPAPALASVVEGFRRLMLDGSLGTPALTFWNSYKVLARAGQYPWQAMQGETPLALDRIGVAPDWHVSGALYGPSAEHVALAERSLRRAMSAELEQLAVVQLSGDAINAHAGLFVGTPDAANLGSMYWRKPAGVPDDPDPDRDRCGLIWLCPALPFRGSDCIAAVEIIERIVLRAGFEPNIGFNALNPRALDVFVAIAYDRDIAGEDARAMRCHDDLMAALVSAGYLPSRLGVQSMNSLPEPADDFGKLMQRIKGAMDPADIMAPGRYDFRADWPSARHEQR
jgi:4-cresol dehydrogenase (hydroxylating) flavoprotein subunit